MSRTFRRTFTGHDRFYNEEGVAIVTQYPRHSPDGGVGRTVGPSGRILPDKDSCPTRWSEHKMSADGSVSPSHNDILRKDSAHIRAMRRGGKIQSRKGVEEYYLDD